MKEGEETRVQSWLSLIANKQSEDKNGSSDLRSPLHVVDENGMMVLHWCCDRGHAKIAKMLLDEGNDGSILVLGLTVFNGQVNKVKMMFDREGTADKKYISIYW